MSSGRLLALFVALGSLWPGAATAGPPPANANAESVAAAGRAKELFAESAAHYQRGEFGEAIELLREAFELAGEPVLLYNLGRAYEGDGQLAQAVAAYERYLELERDIADRGALEKRIATLRRQLEERQALEQQARQARAERERAREQPPAATSAPSPLPWILVGVGAAGVVVGGVLGALAASSETDAEDDPIHQSAAETLDEGRTLATAANVSFIAGGAVALGGLIWGIVELADPGEDGAEPPVTVGMAPLGVTVSGRLRW